MKNSSLPVSDMDCHSLVDFLGGSYALWYFVLVEPFGPLPFFFLLFFLSFFALLPSEDDDNLCYLWFNLPKSLARDGGLQLH